MTPQYEPQFRPTEYLKISRPWELEWQPFYFLVEAGLHYSEKSALPTLHKSPEFLPSALGDLNFNGVDLKSSSSTDLWPILPSLPLPPPPSPSLG